MDIQINKIEFENKQNSNVKGLYFSIFFNLINIQ